ncbi:MAG TPA: carboxypeptidase-like regulatory domain-containing protein, partial [Puia sp.]|nr:carboxypeptidase-like regulatory domain-containing protein [Puia sp.]
MFRPLILFLLVGVAGFRAEATRVTGTVTDDKGNPLGYASILVKGTTRGVTAGSDGKYVLELSPGEYTLVCQYVGYARREKKISVGGTAQVVDFRLPLQQLSLAEVVVRPGGEDPAYAIIRHAIRKRRDYESPLDSFTCEAYVKTLIRT